jgi:hypothetical protein
VTAGRGARCPGHCEGAPGEGQRDGGSNRAGGTYHYGTLKERRARLARGALSGGP